MKIYDYIICFINSSVGCFAALYYDMRQVNAFTILASIAVGLSLIAFIYCVAWAARRRN